VVAVIKH